MPTAERAEPFVRAEKAAKAALAAVQVDRPIATGSAWISKQTTRIVEPAEALVVTDRSAKVEPVKPPAQAEKPFVRALASTPRPTKITVACVEQPVQAHKSATMACVAFRVHPAKPPATVHALTSNRTISIVGRAEPSVVAVVPIKPIRIGLGISELFLSNAP